MDLDKPPDQPAERRVSSRPPTGSRYKRLRREINTPEEFKKILFHGLRPGVLLVLAVLLGAATYLVK